MLFYEIITVVNRYLYLMVLIASCILCDSARCAMLPCKRAPIKFQSNGSQQAIHTVFVYARYGARQYTRHTIRYMPIRGWGNCLREVVRFLCAKLGTYVCTTYHIITILMYEICEGKNYCKTECEIRRRITIAYLEKRILLLQSEHN